MALTSFRREPSVEGGWEFTDGVLPAPAGIVPFASLMSGELNGVVPPQWSGPAMSRDYIPSGMAHLIPYGEDGLASVYGKPARDYTQGLTFHPVPCSGGSYSPAFPGLLPDVPEPTTYTLLDPVGSPPSGYGALIPAFWRGPQFGVFSATYGISGQVTGANEDLYPVGVFEEDEYQRREYPVVVHLLLDYPRPVKMLGCALARKHYLGGVVPDDATITPQSIYDPVTDTTTSVLGLKAVPGAEFAKLPAETALEVVDGITRVPRGAFEPKAREAYLHQTAEGNTSFATVLPKGEIYYPEVAPAGTAAEYERAYVLNIFRDTLGFVGATPMGFTDNAKGLNEDFHRTLEGYRRFHHFHAGESLDTDLRELLGEVVQHPTLRFGWGTSLPSIPVTLAQAKTLCSGQFASHACLYSGTPLRGPSLQLTAGRDVVLYLVIANEDETPYYHAYDLSRPVLVIGAPDSPIHGGSLSVSTVGVVATQRLSLPELPESGPTFKDWGAHTIIEGSLVAGSYMPMLGQGDFKVVQFVVPYEVVQGYLTKAAIPRMELQFLSRTFSGSSIPIGLTRANALTVYPEFFNVVFKAFSGEWLHEFKEGKREGDFAEAVRVGVLGSSHGTLSMVPSYWFGRKGPDGATVEVTTQSFGAVRAADAALTQTLRVRVSGVSTTTGLKLQLQKPAIPPALAGAATISSRTAGDYKVTTSTGASVTSMAAGAVYTIPLPQVSLNPWEAYTFDLVLTYDPASYIPNYITRALSVKVLDSVGATKATLSVVGTVAS